MLTVDIDQLNAEFAQNGNSDQRSVHPADIFTVQINLPLDDGFRVIFHTVFGKPAELRHIGKHRPNRSLSCAGTDHIPVRPFAQNGGNSINDDGFTCTGFTGKDIKALVK